jgi:hypothetical protein
VWSGPGGKEERGEYARLVKWIFHFLLFLKILNSADSLKNYRKIIKAPKIPNNFV